MTLYHDTLQFERYFDCRPSRLFEAYSDPHQREAWSAPGPDSVFEILASDFRSGGIETARCGSVGNLNWMLETAYHLVEPDRTITFTEVLRDVERLLTVALVTWNIVPEGSGCQLHLTDQIASFVGADGVDGHRSGYEAALTDLTQRLVSV